MCIRPAKLSFEPKGPGYHKTGAVGNSSFAMLIFFSFMEDDKGKGRSFLVSVEFKNSNKKLENPERMQIHQFKNNSNFFRSKVPERMINLKPLTIITGKSEITCTGHTQVQCFPAQYCRVLCSWYPSDSRAHEVLTRKSAVCIAIMYLKATGRACVDPQA